MSAMRSERSRTADHAIALLLAAAVAIAHKIVAGTDPRGAFLLSSVAVALSAWRGGVSPGAVAALASLLIARVLWHVDATLTLLFAAESAAITWLAATASATLDRRADDIAAADVRIRDLLAVQRGLRTIDIECDRLERAATDRAVVVLDVHGRILDWRAGAARLFGWDARDMAAENAVRLWAGGDSADLAHLLAASTAGTASRFSRRHRRADGSEFDADVEIQAVPDTAPQAFTMIVSDRTREQEWQAFAESSNGLQRALREEADLAQVQLATLQHMTDPSLNSLPTSQAVTALLDRLRSALHADGVALIRSGGVRRRIISAPEGLKPEGPVERRSAETRTAQPGRILIVHNDADRVSTASAAVWPETVTSLIAVPIVSGSHIDGTIEVVGIRARRATEWEIALVEVVAARITGRLHDEPFVSADVA